MAYGDKRNMLGDANIKKLFCAAMLNLYKNFCTIIFMKFMDTKTIYVHFFISFTHSSFNYKCSVEKVALSNLLCVF